MPALCRITIFPIKSLDGCDVGEAGVLASGALAGDRRWAIVDPQGRFINGKRTAAVHLIRASYDETLTCVTLRGPIGADSFDLNSEQDAAARWLSEVLGVECRMIENAAGGFPDDSAAAGPTVVSRASLEAAAAWFEVSLAEMRRRVRANLEIDAAEPFWEDRLGDDGLRSPKFTLGPAAFLGRTICQRCVVPTRDSQTGAADAAFARRFAERRKGTLPPWAPRPQFDHYYRLAINTSVDRVEEGAILRTGDELLFDSSGHWPTAFRSET